MNAPSSFLRFASGSLVFSALALAVGCSSDPIAPVGTGGTVAAAGGTTGGSSGGTTGTTDPVVIDADADPPTPITNGIQGYATRYWDCCKLHCSWIDHANESGVTPLSYCAADGVAKSKDASVETQAQSACGGGSAYACYDNIPRAVGTSGRLSYGYAAVSGGSGKCGACYQLEFDGTGKYNATDKGSVALGAAQKIMIVQATNIGYDVGANHFDIQIPGGGVGAFDACTAQWGNAGAMGERYGGLLTSCENQLGGEASLDSMKSCVRGKCDALFNTEATADLKDACYWFVDWFEVANNPQFKYAEVPCPSYFSANWD